MQNTDGFDTMDAKNIHLDNFAYQGADNGPAITQGTSKMLISNVVWANFTGYTNGRSVTRSKVNNLVFEGLDIIDGKTGSVEPERGVEGTGFNNT